MKSLNVCIAPCLSARSITLSIVPCRGTVCVDVLRFLLALHNVVVNAVEAMHCGVGTLTIEALWRPSEVEIQDVR